MQFTPLEPAQRADFERDGFLIVRNVLDRSTIDRLIAAGDRLVQSERQESRQRTSDGLYDGFRNCISMDDAFVPLMTHPKVVPLVVQIMGPNLSLMTSHLIYKHPDPAGTPATKREPGWHRDIAGVDSDLGAATVPMLDIKVAYYLTDLLEPSSGSTLFSPGSHRLTSRLEIPAGRVDPLNVVEPTLAAGDCVLFENRTWHAAATNLSGRTRKAVMIGFTYMWMRPSDYQSQTPELVEKLDPIGRQLIGALKDARGHFVPGGISTPLKEWWQTNGLSGYPKP